MLGKLTRGLFNLSTFACERGPPVTRFYMYQRLARYKAERASGQRVLAISRSRVLAELLGFDRTQITDCSYPAENLLSLSYGDGLFDACVSDQVLEHIEGNPFVGVAESFRVVKSGGLVCHTTCFINPLHSAPGDYWRFTPNALALLVGERGRVIELGSWGNAFVWPYCAMGLRFCPIPLCRVHPAHFLANWNDERWAIVTWVIAEKN